MKVYFIRHGQSTANRDRIYAGQSDVSLTEEGKKEAEELRPFFASITFDKVYTSNLSRAMDTQKIALPGVLAEPTPLLREFDVGEMQGKPFGTRLSQNAETEGDCAAGESREDVKRRLLCFLQMLTASGFQSVALFTHNGILNTMLRYVLGDALPQSVNRNCAVLVFEYDGVAWHYLPCESRI